MDEGVTLRPPPVCTGRGGRWLRTEWEPPTLRAALWLSTRPTWAPPRWLTASPTTRDCVCRVLALQDIATCSQFRYRSSSEMQVPEVMGPEGRERSRSTALVSCPQRPPGPVIRSTHSFEYRALTERGTRWITKAFLPSRAVGVDAPICFLRASALFHWTQSS